MTKECLTDIILPATFTKKDLIIYYLFGGMIVKIIKMLNVNVKYFVLIGNRRKREMRDVFVWIF